MAKPCRLTRNYSIASLVGILLVALALVLFYREIATGALMEREGQANSDIARTLANSLWPRYGTFIRSAGRLPLEQLKQREELARLHSEIVDKIQGLRVVKVKIYDLNGLVIFSTQASQIGDNKYSNPGFQSARSGVAASEIVYRDQFSTYEKEVYHRNLVASYVPVASAFDEPVEGVVEIYSDVTPLMVEMEQSGYRIVTVVVGLLLLLYLFLVIIVRRADVLITRQNRAQEQLQRERLSFIERHDELTGLYNRNGILHILNTAQKRSLGLDTSLGVMLIKLANFKEINDSVGHRLGDKLLRLAAERISASAPGGDSVGRIDGDEFVLVLENLISEQELDFIVSRLHNMFSEPFPIGGRYYSLSLAIGVCTSEYGDYSTEQLLMNGGSALGVAKYTPGSRYVMFDEKLEQEKQLRFERTQELSRAVEEQEFVLYYQPRVEAARGKVVGMEALLRWQHPERGLVMPGHFIDMLEESGRIIDLGPWLLQQACSQCKSWHDEGHSELRVAVNISVKQLHADNFLQTVTDALEQSGLLPQYLELELTESMLVADKLEVGDLLRDLKRLGVMLSLDDFGTGYSSLSYLMHFPLDHLKIDRSFVCDITHNRDHATLTNTIIAMAKSLNLGIVAEGIETLEQLELLQAMGCEELQGYYFSQAVEADAFLEVLGTVENKPLLEGSRSTH